jgi:hypothetical protein
MASSCRFEPCHRHKKFPEHRTALTLDPLIDVPTHKSGRVVQSCQFNGIDPHKWARDTGYKAGLADCSLARLREREEG